MCMNAHTWWEFYNYRFTGQSWKIMDLYECDKDGSSSPCLTNCINTIAGYKSVDSCDEKIYGLFCGKLWCLIGNSDDWMFARMLA